MGNKHYMLKSVKKSQFQDFTWILESYIQGSRNRYVFQKVQKFYTNLLCCFFLCNQKPPENSLFLIISKYFGKSSSQKKTNSIYELILNWFFPPSIKLVTFQKFISEKCSRIFNLMHFKLWPAPSGGFTKKAN